MDERLTHTRILGLCLELVGVAVLVGWSPLRLSLATVAAVGASLLAALTYALAGVYARKAFADTAPLTAAIGQQLGASLVLSPLALPALAVAPPGHLSGGVLAAVLALALLSTAVAYLLYFHLIASVGSTRTLSVTFLVPVFGVLWSAMFLGEALHAGTLIGLGIILCSVGLVTGVPLPLLGGKHRFVPQPVPAESVE